MTFAAERRMPRTHRRIGWIAGALALASSACLPAEGPVSQLEDEPLEAEDAAAIEALVDSGATELDADDSLRVRVTNLTDARLRFEIAAIVSSELGSAIHYGLAEGELDCDDYAKVDFPLEALELPTEALDAPGIIELMAILEPPGETPQLVTSSPLYFEPLADGFVIFEEE